MSLIQDKLGNEFLRSNGGMEPGFGPSMLMFSHLPPVTSFTRLASQTVMADLQPHEMILKKERDSPDCGGGLSGGMCGGGGIVGMLGSMGDYVHAMGIKQEKVSEHDYRLPFYSGGGVGTGLRSGGELLEVSLGDHQNLVVHDLSLGNLSGRLVKESSGRKGRRSNCEGQEGKTRRKRGESKYFSRTDRLLKHKRTCGDGTKKGADGSEHELGVAGDGEHGSYGITQGNVATPGRKRGKSKNAGEGGERKRKKPTGAMGAIHSQEADAYGLHDFNLVTNNGVSTTSSAQSDPSMDGEPGRAPKMAFKKGNRKSMEKNALSIDQSKPGGMELPGGGLDTLGLLPGPGAKVGPNSSNYDDAIQFLKKRRYLHVTNNGPAGALDYDVGVSHLQSQPTVIQGVVSGVLDTDASLGLLDTSPLGDIKHDKSGIPDEVLQSLLDHYAHKPDVTFDISDTHHVELQTAATDPLGHDDAPSSPNSGDKAVIMHEYSRFLLQALERTSHSSGFPLGPCPGSAATTTVQFSGPSPLLSDKHVYTSSPLEYSFSHPVSSSPSLSSVPKSHFGLLEGSSPPQGFHMSSLEQSAHAQQQLTPSQELTEQLDKQHTSPPPPPHTPNTNTYQIAPQPPDLGSQKEPQGPKNGATATTGGFSLGTSQDLTTLASAKAHFQIENFAQAFGAQFKGGRVPLAFTNDSRGEVNHSIQTQVSEFSGYSSLLVDASDAVSTGSKTPTSQSYR
ncbi:Zinc finger protein 1 [Triplophysa tibetana]|uniref:Zinc finger protein 1 n=1 Tax=Triplophysa tibetana TaxID=1572043 RepID=A0A5A9N946_9TELE|nr:Zinc finger protein 1 [Triplophysa tibetana]